MRLASSAVVVLAALTACSPGSGGSATDSEGTGGGTDGSGGSSGAPTTGEPVELDVYGFANGCYALRSGDTYLAASGDAKAFGFTAAVWAPVAGQTYHVVVDQYKGTWADTFALQVTCKETSCQDGLDNDQDDKPDCADPDCAAFCF